MAKAQKAEPVPNDGAKASSDAGQVLVRLPRKKAAEVAAGEPGAEPPKVTKLQSYVIERWHRRDIKGAEYNPRVISDAQRRKLKKGLEVHGLVTPITVNRRTHNIVGGHQRIAQIDDIEGTDDYYLDVAVISISERRERELNLLLNNREAQGDFDIRGVEDLLAAMNEEKPLDLVALGFDRLDLEMAFEPDQLAHIFGLENAESPEVTQLVNVALPQVAPRPAPPPPLTEQQKADIKAAKKASVEKGRAANDREFYCVLVFESDVQCTAFLKAVGQDGTQRTVPGIDVCAKLGVTLE